MVMFTALILIPSCCIYCTNTVFSDNRIPMTLMHHPQKRNTKKVKSPNHAIKRNEKRKKSTGNVVVLENLQRRQRLVIFLIFNSRPDYSYHR